MHNINIIDHACSANGVGWPKCETAGAQCRDAVVGSCGLYEQIFNVVAPIFVMTFVGYLLGRTHRNLDSRTISTAVLTVATPALIFSTLTSLEVAPGTLLKMSISAALCVALAAALALPVLYYFKMSIRTFLPSLMLPNSGNIGLPLVLLAFGDAGLVLAISFFFVVALLQYTVGAAIMSGHYRLGDLVRQPLVWSILAVLLVIATGWPVPTVIARSTQLLGGMMIPAMLLLLGISLSTLKVSDFKPALVIAVFRLIIGIIVGLTINRLLGLEGMEAGIVFLLALMPTAIVNYVFADRYRPDAQQVAGAIVVSTFLTFLLLPGLIAITYWIAAN
jgi:hypothetical protein